MYISEIDNFLEETIDKVMLNWIYENKLKNTIEFKKIISEINFIKYQKEINDFFGELIFSINVDKFKQFVVKDFNMEFIKKTISKYLFYYIFIMIGLNYKGSSNEFMTNLIDFSREQSNFEIKLDGFFLAETNIKINQCVKLINEFTIYLEKYGLGNEKKKYSVELMNFIKKIGEDKITTFKEILKNSENKIVYQHNITKIIVFLYIYTNEEKKELFNSIEENETPSDEYIFIDIVVPIENFTDINSIESILSPKEIKTSMVEIIYELINSSLDEEMIKKRDYFLNLDAKIQNLLKTKYIFPIVDDFLLYHKNNEKYDEIEKVNKKKEDTKLKFIVNKINLVKEFYKNKTEIEKKFYQPMKNKNILLVNDFENIKILQKLKKVLNTNEENVILENDLNKFRKYPYISFSDIENNGFFLKSSETLECVRSVSFTQKNKNTPLQLRIMSKTTPVNIIGLLFLDKEQDIHCVHTECFKNIHDLTKNPKKYIIEYLSDRSNNQFYNVKNKTKNNVYWIFDCKKDDYSIPNYDISSLMSKNESVRILMSYFYDEMITNIIKNFSKFIPKGNDICFYLEILNKIKNHFPTITNEQYSNEYNDMINKLYFLMPKKNCEIYDKREDLFLGLFGDVISLPQRDLKINTKTEVIKIASDYIHDIPEKKQDVENNIFIDNKDELNDVLEMEFEDQDNKNNDSMLGNKVICQHFIHWENLNLLEKTSKNDYSKLVYEFGQQYIKVNNNMEYLCKSCNSPLDIKRFILDGSFDSHTQYFVTNAIEVKVNIEELEEYEKYRTAIKNVEKIIERFASIFNIGNINGISYNARKNRRGLVKDTIDLILTNNVNAKKKYLGIRDKFTEKFGIDKLLSNFFIFELDNTIFIYSTKDKDFYKIIKYNNIIAYILIILIMELTDSQILSLNFDKICNYSIYKKIQNILFSNLKIISNKDNEPAPILDYPILCYVIFMFSCFVTKYGLWGDVYTSEKSNNKKFDPNKQKSIIQTLVELINIIMSSDVEEMKKNRIYLYESLQNKYFLRLKLFKDIKLIASLDKAFLKEYEKKEINIHDESNKFDIQINIKRDFVCDEIYQKYIKFPNKRYCTIPLINNINFLRHVSNLTNCYDGKFHKFQFDKIKKQYHCELCHKTIGITDYEEKSFKTTKNKILINYLVKLLEKYCKDGDFHQFEYDKKNDKSKCAKCGYVLGDKISLPEKELTGIYHKINHKNINKEVMKNKEIQKSIDFFKQFTHDVKNVLEKMVYKFEKKSDNNINKIIDKFLDTIQQLLGTNVVYENEMYNLKYNTYIVDHDNNGQDLEKTEIISENDNKFREVENHHHFKRNVIIYTKQKNTKYEIFYDSQNKTLLGYRETNKDYMKINSKGKKLKINYSIKNILLMFGFTRKVIDIKDFYPELFGISDELYKKNFSNFDMNLLLNKISDRRLEIIKNLGNELNKYIYRFKNNYDIKVEFNDKNQIIDKNEYSSLDILYIEYKRKINNQILTTSQDNKHRFLKHNNILYKYLPYQNINFTSKELDYSELISYDFLIKYDFNSNIQLNYILEEIIRLISYNKNKHMKTNIAHFIINLIINIFNRTNYEILKFDTEVNYFYQILYTSEFYLETQNTDFFVDALDYFDDKEEDFDTIEDKNNKQQQQQHDDEYDNEFTKDTDVIDGFDVENEEDDDENDGFDIDGSTDYEGLSRAYAIDAPDN